jgi:hypothetical protein
MTLEMAIEEAEQLLADAAESTIRMVLIGWTIGRAMTPPKDGEKAMPAGNITKVQEIAVQTVSLPADGIGAL